MSKPTLWEDVAKLRDDIFADWSEDDPTQTPMPTATVVLLIVNQLNEILARHTVKRAVLTRKVMP